MASAREEKICKMYREGSTLKQIGAEFGISRERVRQILNKIIPLEDVKKLGKQHLESQGLRNKVKPWKLKLAAYMRNSPTRSEAILFEKINRRQLGFPVYRQAVIRGWVVDFYIPSKKLVIELDGKFHKWGNSQAKDELRDKKLSSLGIKTLRIPSSKIFSNLDLVLEEIKNAIN